MLSPFGCGAEQQRDFKIQGIDKKGVHYAMEYLIQQNDRIANSRLDSRLLIDAKGKKCGSSRRRGYRF